MFSARVKQQSEVVRMNRQKALAQFVTNLVSVIELSTSISYLCAGFDCDPVGNNIWGHAEHRAQQVPAWWHHGPISAGRWRNRDLEQLSSSGMSVCPHLPSWGGVGDELSPLLGKSWLPSSTLIIALITDKCWAPSSQVPFHRWYLGMIIRGWAYPDLPAFCVLPGLVAVV